MYRALIPLLLLAACSSEPSHLGNPLLLPLSGLSTAAGNAAYNQRRGRVELIVKSSFPGIIGEIRNGGGPALTEAMNAAGIPASDRPARILQMQGDLPIYAGNPDALVVALMVYAN